MKNTLLTLLVLLATAVQAQKEAKKEITKPIPKAQ